MTEQGQSQGFYIDVSSLPGQFPTHRHNPKFWEALGRTIATFSFLEEVLGKAIFAFTATRKYDESEIEAAFTNWLPTLERALTDPLRSLINSYRKAVRGHPDANVGNLDELVDSLCNSSAIRNVLCHGSWGAPDDAGKSLPLFVDRQKMVFTTAVDISFLQQTQRHVAELACTVIDTVTQMGWQFPGSNGPGKLIMG